MSSYLKRGCGVGLGTGGYGAADLVGVILCIVVHAGRLTGLLCSIA